jgi:virginiamycin A acetyltransferase
MIEIAQSARVSALADIEDSVRGSRIVIGERVVIGPDTLINSGCVLHNRARDAAQHTTSPRGVT